jgi:hypothetical protein
MDAGSEIPSWVEPQDFFSVTRSIDELSVVSEERHIPAGSDAGHEVRP